MIWLKKPKEKKVWDKQPKALEDSVVKVNYFQLTVPIWVLYNLYGLNSDKIRKDKQTDCISEVQSFWNIICSFYLNNLNLINCNCCKTATPRDLQRDKLNYSSSKLTFFFNVLAFLSIHNINSKRISYFIKVCTS